MAAVRSLRPRGIAPRRALESVPQELATSLLTLLIRSLLHLGYLSALVDVVPEQRAAADRRHPQPLAAGQREVGLPARAGAAVQVDKDRDEAVA